MCICFISAKEEDVLLFVCLLALTDSVKKSNTMSKVRNRIQNQISLERKEEHPENDGQCQYFSQCSCIIHRI